MGDLHFLLDDDIPEDEYIAWGVLKLCLNRSGGPSVIRAGHLRQWLIAARQDDLPGATNCHKVVAIAQASLCEGTLDEECTVQTVI